jgi:hypothetical protein
MKQKIRLNISPGLFFRHSLTCIFQDADENNSRIQFGLRWQLIPVNISFRANDYISPVQFFMINPVRRFTGSFEVFVQPEGYRRIQIC